MRIASRTQDTGRTHHAAVAELRRTRLAGTKLSTANLGGVTSGGISGGPRLAAGWRLIRGYLVGPGANLTGANLAGIDLTGVDLTGTTLTGVTSGGITGGPVGLPRSWRLSRGYIVGPGANLAGANL
ncbi:MAG: pentapeptide repeat-containing protein, partial [Actinobacteria bacterium]|nr:pentapeptide repeat-containing protein [Actinomycetota bacterium]